MKTCPLGAVTLDEAREMQFRLVELIHQEFTGREILYAGDYGVAHGLGRPLYTSKVERVIARFFDSEDAVLVRGAGTGAIRLLLMSLLSPGDAILIHDAPVYPTTWVTVQAMGLRVVRADINDIEALRETVLVRKPRLAFVQHTRQRISDSYILADILPVLKSTGWKLTVVVDENYAVMRVPRIGCQMGADASAFSLFKLFGPEGLGCIVGRGELIDRIRANNYSGGSQVQGPEAMDALRSLVFAPVAQAIQNEVVTEVAERLNNGEVPGVKAAHVANAEERVILVEFAEPIAPKVLDCAWKYGAAPYPVGSDSRYEVSCMFYRVSATLLADDPQLAHTTIRVNPMRAGPDTVINVLRRALEEARKSVD